MQTLIDMSIAATKEKLQTHRQIYLQFSYLLSTQVLFD